MCFGASFRFLRFSSLFVYVHFVVSVFSLSLSLSLSLAIFLSYDSPSSRIFFRSSFSFLFHSIAHPLFRWCFLSRAVCLSLSSSLLAFSYPPHFPNFLPLSPILSVFIPLNLSASLNSSLTRSPFLRFDPH